jgi:hypothetical protein
MKVFISYSHKDKRHWEQLVTHLSLLKREGLLDVWHDRKITGGEEWAEEIDNRLFSQTSGEKLDRRAREKQTEQGDTVFHVRARSGMIAGC